MDSLKVSLSAANAAFEGAVDAATMFREQATKAGIDIEIVREPADGYWSSVWMKKPFVVSYWGGRPTEDWMFSQVYASDAKWNESYWKDPAFDKLLLEARCRARRGKAARSLCADAGFGPRRGRQHHPDVRQLRRCPLDARDARRENRLELGARRQEAARALVDGLGALPAKPDRFAGNFRIGNAPATSGVAGALCMRVFP